MKFGRDAFLYVFDIRAHSILAGIRTTVYEMNIVKVAGYIWGIIARPAPTFHRILTDRAFAVTFSLVLAWCITGSVEVYFSLSEQPRDEVIISTLLFPVMSIFIWLALSFILYLSGRELGGKATLKDIILITGVACIAFVVFDLLASISFILVRFVGFELLSHISQGIPIICIFILWSVALVVVGMREAQGFSSGRAIACVIIAVLCALVVGVLVIITVSGFDTLFRYSFKQ